jgi:hypothetical protein
VKGSRSGRLLEARWLGGNACTASVGKDENGDAAVRQTHGMVETLFNVVATLVGLYAVLFNKKAAADTINFWNGLKANLYGEKDLAWIRSGFVFVGALFIAYGLRSLWS